MWNTRVNAGILCGKTRLRQSQTPLRGTEHREREADRQKREQVRGREREREREIVCVCETLCEMNYAAEYLALVFQGLREIQHISDEPDKHQRDLFL